MKKHLYAVYRGIRYEATKISSRKYQLTARGAECPEGFVPAGRRLRTYYKNAFPDELDSLYLIESVAVYKGYRLRVVDADADGVTVVTEDAVLSSVLEMEDADGLYHLNLARDDLTRIIDYMTFYEQTCFSKED